MWKTFWTFLFRQLFGTFLVQCSFSLLFLFFDVKNSYQIVSSLIVESSQPFQKIAIFQLFCSFLSWIMISLLLSAIFVVIEMTVLFVLLFFSLCCYLLGLHIWERGKLTPLIHQDSGNSLTFSGKKGLDECKISWRMGRILHFIGIRVGLLTSHTFQ